MLVFTLQLGSQKVQQPRCVFSDAFDALDTIPQSRDLFGDCGALFLVLCKHSRIGLVPDLIAHLAAFGLQCGDLRFRLRDIPVQIVERMQLVFFQKPLIGIELRIVLQLVPQIGGQDHFFGVMACKLDQRDQNRKDRIDKDRNRMLDAILKSEKATENAILR